jgi:C4-dicarboxylate transporter, DctQ subunit
MRNRKNISSIFDHLNDYAVILAGAIIIFIMISVTVDVTLRFLFSRPLDWTLDISQILLLYIPFLSAAWVLRKDGHIRIDILFDLFPIRMRNVLNNVNAILGALIFLLITWYGSQVTLDLIGKHALEQRLDIPTFSIIIIIPIGSFLLFLQYSRLAWTLFRKSRARISEISQEAI